MLKYLAFALPLLFATSTHAASFDCAKAQAPDEKAICAHLDLNDADVRKGVTMPASWIDAVSQSAPVSQLALPVIIPVTEFRDIMGVGLTNLLAGADPTEEMKKATEAFRPVLARSEAA